MQLDMHYYGTYAMARAAGLSPAVCRTIATCSQFVDDNAHGRSIEFLDGARIDSEPTAHHVASVGNIKPEDQRMVWVPFHFLPGNEGDTYSERLLCRKDSAIAREMLRHHLGYAKHDIGVHLIGVAAHAYADTFSHYGFSGVSSRRNKVVNDSFVFQMDLDKRTEKYIKGKADRFFETYRRESGLLSNVKSWLAETFSGALGHGAVATYPDRPFLKWSFDYEYPQRTTSERDNQATFLEGCRELHRLFRKLGKVNPALSSNDGVAFKELRPTVKRILAHQGKKAMRVAQWKDAAADGSLTGQRFRIPNYNAEPWLRKAAQLSGTDDSRQALGSDLYLFFRAASQHREYVLRDLLPSHNIVVR